MKKLTILLACIFAFVTTSALASNDKIKSLKLIDSTVPFSSLIQFEIDIDDTDDMNDNDDDLDVDGEITAAKGYSGYYAVSKGNKIVQYLIITVKDENDSDVEVDVEFLDMDDNGNETTDQESPKLVFGKEFQMVVKKGLKIGIAPMKRDIDGNGILDGKVSATCTPAAGAEDSELKLHSRHTWTVENKSTEAQVVDVDLELWVDWDGDGIKDLDEDDVDFEKDILVAPLSKVSGSQDLYLPVVCPKKGEYKFYAETELDDFDTADKKDPVVDPAVDTPDVPDDFDIEIITEGLLVVQ